MWKIAACVLLKRLNNNNEVCINDTVDLGLTRLDVAILEQKMRVLLQLMLKENNVIVACVLLMTLN